MGAGDLNQLYMPVWNPLYNLAPALALFLFSFSDHCPPLLVFILSKERFGRERCFNLKFRKNGFAFSVMNKF